MSKKQVSKQLCQNVEWMSEQLKDCADAVMRTIEVGAESKEIFIVYMDSMYDRDLVDGVILKNLLFDLPQIPNISSKEGAVEPYLATADIKKKSDMEEIVVEILKGNTALFIDAMGEAIIISSKNLPGRGVSEAETEVSVRGSKESFTESFRTNTVLLRRRIRDTRLKSKQMLIGRRSKTDICLMYLDDLVRPEILKALEEKIGHYDIDAILDCHQIEQLTEEKWYSPFPQYQSTERPDKAASALLEGRIVVVVDNSPMVLMVPATFPCFFQASDDYYDRLDTVWFVRLLRYIAAFMAVCLPALYIAAAGFHSEILPLSFALSFAASREGVPFSLPVEVLVMELAFELLREAGIRLPGPMGSTLGIVGGLIIGQAAVDAHIVSPVVVIIVALTALSAFTIPNDLFASAFRMLKFYCIILASLGGFLGLLIALLSILTHLCSLKIFGIPYMMPFGQRVKHEDIIFKAPIQKMRMRPVFTKKGHRRRLSIQSEEGQDE